MAAGGLSPQVSSRPWAGRSLRAPSRASWPLVVAVLLVACLDPLPSQAAEAPGALGPRAGWAWPLDPEPVVLAGFDAPAGPFAAGHRGVDLAAAVGQPVLAAGPGTVAFAGSVAGKPVVSIDHPGGLRTTYVPVLAEAAAGDRVRAGTPVGRVAAVAGHCLPATCLHWGLRSGPGLATYRDPLALLGVLPVRLLPVWGVGAPATSPAGATARPVGHDRGPLMAGLR